MSSLSRYIFSVFFLLFASAGFLFSSNPVWSQQDMIAVLNEGAGICSAAIRDTSDSKLRFYLRELPDTVTLNWNDPATNENHNQQIPLLWLKQYLNSTAISDADTHDPYQYNEYVKDEDPFTEVTDSMLLQELKVMDRFFESWINVIAALNSKEAFEAPMSDEISSILNDERYIPEKPEEDKEKDDESDEPVDNSTMQTFTEWLEKSWKVVVFLLIIGGVIFLLIRTSRYISFEKTDEELILSDAGLLSREDPLSSQEMISAAAKAADAADLRNAVRSYYLSVILLLHEKKVIRYSPSLTNWEYSRLMTANGLDPLAVETLTSVFDRMWYGDEQIGPEEFDQFKLSWKSIASVLNPGVKL